GKASARGLYPGGRSRFGWLFQRTTSESPGRGGWSHGLENARSKIGSLTKGPSSARRPSGMAVGWGVREACTSLSVGIDRGHVKPAAVRAGSRGLRPALSRNAKAFAHAPVVLALGQRVRQLWPRENSRVSVRKGPR